MSGTPGRIVAAIAAWEPPRALTQPGVAEPRLPPTRGGAHTGTAAVAGVTAAIARSTSRETRMTVLAPLLVLDCTPDARLASPALPELARDGYLTGVIVAPQPLTVLRWLAPLLAGDDLLLADNRRFRAERDAILAQYTAMATAIDRHLARLEAGRICDYRPAFWPGDTKPAHSMIRRWAGGFATAMALVPDAWSALLEDELTAMLVAPFVGFFGIDDPRFEPAEDFAQRLDEAAAFMPRAILVLRKLARMRARRAPEDAQMPPGKIGRNDPCPCGSGTKYKRCCGTGPH